MSTPPLFTTSFESPYVSLDLLSYLKSKQVTPFQIFNEVIMPGFLHQISKEKLPPQGNSSSTTTTTIITNGDGIVEEDSSWQDMMEEIRNDLTYIRKACGECEEWEMAVNSAIKYLSYQALDDAFKERTEAPDGTKTTDSRHKKLKDTHGFVSKLRKSLYSPPSLSLVNLYSESFQLAKLSMARREFNLHHHSFYLPAQLLDVNVHEVMAESSTLNEVEAVYNELDDMSKLCFLCFSVFPENAVIKKKVLVHWWVGEGFIDTLVTQSKTAEDIASEYFKVFIAKGLIKPVYKKRRPSADSCNMDPSIRYAVIKLAERAQFFNFDTDGNPTEDFTCSQRACLVKTEEGSSIRELPYRLKQENVRSLININEPNLDFRPEWFSKMKNVMVLQLGRWESSAKHLIQVDDSEEFLKGLKNMRHLRYLSLRGVSRITELPASICKLSNLRILNLNGCLDLEQLPQGIGSLKNLTHLDMYECYLISHMPKGLALLSQLQVLKGFVIGEPRPGRQYCKLADLSSLEHLRKLSIHVDIKNKSDAAKRELISLAHFKKLRSLSISWSRLYGTPKKPATLQRTVTKKAATLQRIVRKIVATLQRTVIKKLASLSKPTTLPPPPPLMALASTTSIAVPLEKLNLHYFPGYKIPDWLMQWELSNLKKLYIRGGNLSNLCHGKQSQWTVKMVRLKFLEELQMDCLEMKDWFPDLMYLEIFECPKLSSISCDENGVWSVADSKQETA